ncbi:MAG: hypothetical protein AB7I50_18040 [Vicinamibacterales bacterium]
MRQGFLPVRIAIASVIGTGSLLGLAAPSSAQPAVLRRLVTAPMPARPLSLAADTRGHIWFTLQGESRSVGWVDASECADSLQSCAPVEYELPDVGLTPFFLTVDSRNHIWMTALDEDGGGEILSFDPDAETFQRWPIPADVGDAPHDLAVAGNGTVYFTDSGVGLISLNPVTGTFTVQYRTPANALAGQVAGLGVSIDPSGGVWCTCGLDVVRLGWRLIRGLREILIRDLLVRRVPDARKPYGIVSDSANVAWILDQQSLGLHRFDRQRDAFESWDVPSATIPNADLVLPVDPHWMAVRGNSVYFTGLIGVLGRFDAAQAAFDNYLLSPARADVHGSSGAFDIAIDRAGRVWFTETTANTLTRLDVRRLSPPRIPPPIPDF